MLRKKCAQLLSLGAALAVYCVLALLLHIPCPIKWFTGISCPGCGMTRAVYALCRLDISAALYYHPLVFYMVVAVPGLILCYLKDAVKLRKILAGTSVALLIGVYLYRMIIVNSPVLVCDPGNGVIPRLFAWVIK